MRKKSEILEIMEIFNRDDPNPRCELNYSNAYTLLVAVVLSAQTTDKGVNRATAELFKVADTPENGRIGRTETDFIYSHHWTV